VLALRNVDATVVRQLDYTLGPFAGLVIVILRGHQAYGQSASYRK
jgi:hypothetical protein